MNDKLINYMVRYDNLKESMEEEMELLMFQSGLLMVAKCMYSDGLENMTEEEKLEFTIKTIDILQDFISLGKEVALRMNTLVLINDTIGTIAKRLGYYEMLEVKERKDMLVKTIELLTDKEHEVFLNELLKLKDIYSL